MLFRLFLSVVLAVTGSVAAGFDDELTDLFGGNSFNNGGFNFGPDPAEAATVSLSAELVQLDGNTVELKVTVTPPADYYLYSTSTPFGQKTRITLTETAGLEPVQPGFSADHPPKREYSKDFQGDVEKYTSAVTWSTRLTSGMPLTGKLQVAGQVDGQICTTGENGEGGVCVLLSPSPEFSAELQVDETMPPAAPEAQAAASPVVSDLPAQVTVVQEGIAADQANLSYTVVLGPDSAQIGEEVVLSITADMKPGWHTYAHTIPDEELGASPTRFHLQEVHGLEAVDEDFTASGDAEMMDNPLGDPLEVYEHTVTWTRRYLRTAPAVAVHGRIDGQICTETTCDRPGEAFFAVGLGDAVSGGARKPVPPAAEQPGEDAAGEVLQVGKGVAEKARRKGLLPFLLAAVGAGFVALLTPCVFPMIPVTVAFFLKQGESGKGNTKLLAVIYCLGIIGTFTVIGVLVSIVFGPEKMTELANGAWLNLLFAVVFVAFALMLMGVFELRVPTFLLNWSAQREGKGGVLGVLFMALTFTLVSFTCTAAFVANLLVLAAKGDYLWPTLGMLAFSTAFASPFFFLALFPGFLSTLPKSGGWMQKVKCTAGLVELAFVVKFLSVADIGFSPDATPRFLDFSTALVLWATLAFVTGLYLLGVFRFSKDTPSDGISPVGGLWAMGSISLGLLICVGLFSPKPPNNWMWNQIAGFAPPRFEHEDINDQFAELAQSEYWLPHDGLAWGLSVDDASRVARQYNKPLFIDFTGVNCINCRTMEKSVLNQPAVLDLLAQVPRAQLYLDEVPRVSDPAKKAKLLQQNRDLCRQLTGGNAMPTYVLITPDGTQLLSVTTGVVSQSDFTQFIEEGLQRFEQQQAQVARQVPAVR